VLHINPLNAELNPIYNFLVLLGAHHIVHVSGMRVNGMIKARDNIPVPYFIIFLVSEKNLCNRSGHCLFIISRNIPEQCVVGEPG